mgnify:FL=1
MPLLGSDDQLPLRPERVLVAGTSGAGKTTLARRLAAAFELVHTETDALFHGPAWQPRSEFVADVERLVAQPRWVTEWQYHQVRPLLVANADLMVWLDYPRDLVMRRVISRTLWRRLLREELWNGNRERGLWRIFVDRDHIIRWAWRTHSSTATRVARVLEERPELTVVRLRSAAEAEDWLAMISGAYDVKATR